MSTDLVVRSFCGQSSRGIVIAFLSGNETPSELEISQRIYVIRGHRVMIDRDLAILYGVETKVLNQSVKRNISRFPGDFMFQLNEIEEKSLRSQFVTSKQTVKEAVDTRQLPLLNLELRCFHLF